MDRQSHRDSHTFLGYPNHLSSPDKTSNRILDSPGLISLAFIMSSPEEIRAKRLARLAAVAHPVQPEQRAADANPVVKRQEKSKPEPSKLTTTPIDTVNSEQPALERPQKARKEENIKDWTQTNLERILNASLSPERAVKKGYTQLISIQEDEASGDGTIDFDMIDPALLEILTEQGVGTKFESSPMTYLYSTWTRANEARRVVRSDDPLRTDKLRILQEVLRLSSSYASIMFQVPDMFVDPVDVNAGIEHLWRHVDQRDAFLMDIITRAIENDSVLELLNVIIPPLTDQLVRLDYSNGNADYSKILTTLQIFLNSKPVAQHFHEIDGFHPEGLKGIEFEKKTILGRILRLSPMLPEIAEFNYPEGLTKAQIHKTHESIQTEHSILVGRLFNLCDRLVRAGGEARQQFLEWLADVVNNNHLRRGEHARPEKLASDGFMLNLTLILDRFSQPFLATVNLSKLDKIDGTYLNHREKLIDLSEETKLNSTIQEYNEYYDEDKLVDTPLNFISECFFLLLTYLQYGLGGIYMSASRYTNYIKQMNEQLNKFQEMMQQQGGGGGNNPMMKMLLETKIKPIRKQLARFKAQKQSIDMYFYNRSMQLELFETIYGCITYFMKLIDPAHKYPESPIQVPLHDYGDDTEKMEDSEYTRKLAPVPFKYYPEIFLEGIINYCHYVSKFNNNPMFQNETKLDRFVEFAVTILRCPELVSNPHLKARLTEVLFFGSLPTQNGHDGYMVDVFNHDETVKKNLMVSLLDFYVMVEKTGSSSQFYDKFNSRYHISFILEQLWKFDYFRQDLKKIASKQPRLFIRLIARMLNDTTYLLDESLNHLHTIGACQREISNRARGGQPTMEENDEELGKKLAESERMAKSFVQLSNKTVKLFNLFTKETPRSFVKPEIVDRLAGMLDYNLEALVGPRYNELRVKNPEAYQFDPGELLYQLCSIFINLSDEPEFVDAVARDDRSFDPACYKKAVKILYKVGKVPSANYEKQLLKFAQEAEDKKTAEEDEAMELGDVPDEFLDPLMYTMMTDPVKLPHSKVSMDRSVLMTHLMNDPTDPFNRTPLKLEDVADDNELKTRITEWVAQRKAEIRASKKEAAAEAAADGDGDGDVTMK